MICNQQQECPYIKSFCYYSSSEDDINEIFFEVTEIFSDCNENISNICEIFWKSRYYFLTMDFLTLIKDKGEATTASLLKTLKHMNKS